MTIQAFGALETNATKEMQKIMPTAAPVGAKVGSALATQLRAREALDAAMKLEVIAQKKTGRRYGGDECGQRRSGNGQAGSRTVDGPVTQKDPISNEDWSTQVEMEALLLAEKEYEIKKVTKRLDEAQIQQAMEEGRWLGLGGGWNSTRC